jgi:GNAT superfamily N-acetyltransferase
MKITELKIRAAEDGDYPAWREMWAGYCEFYQTAVPEDVTETTWARILDPESSVHGIVAVDNETGNVLGFANYVLHLHTWSPRTLCYLEDLYVRPEARGRDIGHSLIDYLVARGKEQDWNRVYWHTDSENHVARRLYDRFVPADPYVRYTISLPPNA